MDFMWAINVYVASDHVQCMCHSSSGDRHHTDRAMNDTIEVRSPDAFICMAFEMTGKLGCCGIHASYSLNTFLCNNIWLFDG